MENKLLLESIENNNVEKQYVSFWIENKRFGINIVNIKEIYADVSVTPIYHSSQDVRGYINIRGEIYLIADIRKLLGLQNNFIKSDEKLIILKDSIVESFGIVIDKVDDVICINNNSIEKFSINEENNINEDIPNNNFQIIEGISKLESGLIIILNSTNIMLNILSKNKANQVQ